jgi:hypothetical protein
MFSQKWINLWIFMKLKAMIYSSKNYFKNIIYIIFLFLNKNISQIRNI